MKKFIKQLKKYTFTILAVVAFGIALALSTNPQGTTTFIIVMFSMLGSVFASLASTKAHKDFLKAIDVAAKQKTKAETKEKIAIKNATQSVKAKNKSEKAKKEANSFLN